MTHARAASLFAAALCLAPAPASAAPEEIQVYMDEIGAPGRFGLDMHTNYVLAGERTPAYPGAQAPWHVLRVTPELSYALTPTLELGAYVLGSSDRQRRGSIDGEKVRVKYLAPRAAGQNGFWGLNLEIGRIGRRLDENPWNGELKAILGTRQGPWTVASNANVGFRLSGPRSAPPAFHVDSKLAYRLREGLEIGLESYNELGQIGRLGHLNEQGQTIFGVIDATVAGQDVNIGIGRGVTPASDRWTLKAIFSVPI
jgi:hypothetical protein